MGTPAAPSSATHPSSMANQQMLAHQQQMAAQAQAMVHHPSHMNSIVGSMNGTHSFNSIAMTMEGSTSSIGGGLGGHGGVAPGGPTAQSPTASRVLPPNGMTMSGHANALAAAGIRRPGIVPMQQHQQGSAYNPSHMGSFNPHQHMHQSSQMSIQMAHDGSMSGTPFGGMGGVQMDSTSSGGPGSMSSASIFDVYPNQHRHLQGHPHSHHFIIPGSGSGGDSSSGHASGELSTTATSVENSSGNSNDMMSVNGGHGTRSR